MEKTNHTENIQDRPGMLLVFEGIDGTGKSSQIALAAEKLSGMGFDVVTTREPTDGKFGQQIRKLYTQRGTVSQKQELDLFMADRKEHVEQVIAPGLKAGRIVLTDRYYFSTAAYQGASGNDPEKIIAENEKFAPTPDIVLLISVPVAVSLHRIQTLRGESLNDFEQESNLRKVDVIFDQLSARDYIQKIDGTKSLDEVHEEIMRHVINALGKKGLWNVAG
ncbi:MAG: dTMP kinase [Proteobacteria bacterium]|nr:dTMP kinase [Pseudomonadota bacterium]MBU1710992.1 dTMP kinase [Pseudomonadota bacterium]